MGYFARRNGHRRPSGTFSPLKANLSMLNWLKACLGHDMKFITPARLGLLFTGILTLLPPTYAEQGSSVTPTQSPPGWNEKMQELHKTLSELLTNVSSEQRYQDLKNSGRIESQIRQFANLAHDLKSKGISSNHSDASIRIFADHLSADASEAYRSFHEGRKEYARGLIRSLTNSCVACHSRSASGPQFGELPMADFQSELKPIERARFFSEFFELEFIAVLNLCGDRRSVL